MYIKLMAILKDNHYAIDAENIHDRSMMQLRKTRMNAMKMKLMYLSEN